MNVEKITKNEFVGLLFLRIPVALFNHQWRLALSVLAAHEGR
jgi:hypothetical protein